MTDGASPAPGSSLPWDLTLEPDEARRRFEWARGRGHPQYLWPDVTPHALRGGLRKLEAVAREVVAGRTATLGAGDTPALRALGVAGFASGLGPLVGRWLEDGHVDGTRPVRRLFGTHLDHGRDRAERLRAMTEHAVEALNGAGVEPLVVKSGHTSRTYFPEPGARPSVDVDLVVPAGRFEAAEAALDEAGFTRAAGQSRPRKSDWLAPGAAAWPRSLELLHADSQYAVDLHASLRRNFHGVRTIRPAPVDTVPTEAATFLEGKARVLQQPHLLAYHLLHASEGLEHLTLVRLVEIVLMVRRDTEAGTLEQDDVLEVLARRRGVGFVYPALVLAERLAPGTVRPALLAASEREAPSAMRAVMERMAPADAQRFEILTLSERFMWCSTPLDYARRLAHMLVPAPANRSLPRLARTYVDRIYKLLRGKVEVRRPGG